MNFDQLNIIQRSAKEHFKQSQSKSDQTCVFDKRPLRFGSSAL